MILSETKEDPILILTGNNRKEIIKIERELVNYSSISVFVTIIYPTCMLNNILKPFESTLYNEYEPSLGINLFLYFIYLPNQS